MFITIIVHYIINNYYFITLLNYIKFIIFEICDYMCIYICVCVCVCIHIYSFNMHTWL